MNITGAKVVNNTNFSVITKDIPTMNSIVLLTFRQFFPRKLFFFYL